jgi:hypothetical protein
VFTGGRIDRAVLTVGDLGGSDPAAEAKAHASVQ